MLKDINYVKTSFHVVKGRLDEEKSFTIWDGAVLQQ